MNFQSAFERVRDLPYSIPTSIEDKNYSCSGKVIILRDVFNRNGIESRYRVCDFLWSDLPIPQKILDLQHDDRSTHVYLEVNINGDWIDVDPTWDSGLKTILPINTWGGLNGMPIAVSSLRQYSIEESKSIMENTDSEKAQSEIKRNRNFYIALNEWFQSTRV